MEIFKTYDDYKDQEVIAIAEGQNAELIEQNIKEAIEEVMSWDLLQYLPEFADLKLVKSWEILRKLGENL